MLTKFLCPIFMSCFCSGFAFADIPHANKIKLSVDQFGLPAFGFQYSVRPRPMIAIAFSVKGAQLVGAKSSAVDPVYWAVVNRDTGGLVTPWQKGNLGAGLVSPEASEAFAFSLEGDQAIAVLGHIRSLAIALSLNNNPQHLKPTVYLDLGELCESDQDGYDDLDHGVSGCP